MKIINAGRGFGKTAMLINTSYTTGYPIIVDNEHRKTNVLNLAKKMGLEINVYTVKDISMNYNLSWYHKQILVDDAEKIIEEALTYYFKSPVAAITVNIDQMEKNK